MAFLPAFGALLLSTAGVAGPVTAGVATAAGVAGVATVGAGIYGVTQMGKQQTQMPQAPTATLAPKPEVAAQTAQAKVTEKKRAMARSRSIYSSPAGLAGEATTAKKYLLGT